MESLQDFKEFLNFGYLNYRRNLTIECAIFGYDVGNLQVLLTKSKIITKWCLPAGYVRKKEDLDEAASRITYERTGIDDIFLKQFKTFGNPGRGHSPGAFNKEIFFELTGITLDENNWLMGETLSVGFYAIIDITVAKPKVDFLSSECKWFPMDELPELGYDHNEILQEALSVIKMHLYHFPIGKKLLPEKFTLKEIKLLYEVLSGKTLHITNFPNKLISIGLLVKTDEKRKIGAHRSPTYYKFDDKIYNKVLQEGLVLV
ncbi:MAG: NUDIX domain-containing protein [Bacteroidales bacterium]|nr:NUDIX domain-containing protein [Bacteroidales bacterium]